MNRYFLDTNAVISLFNGNHNIAKELQSAQWVGLSIITKLEFLAYPKITQPEIEQFNKFCEQLNIINLNDNDYLLINRCVKIRKEIGIKLPDAIIGAQALINKAILVSSDTDFSKIPDLEIVNYL